jgi:hypothetical protein
MLFFQLRTRTQFKGSLAVVTFGMAMLNTVGGPGLGGGGCNLPEQAHGFSSTPMQGNTEQNKISLRLTFFRRRLIL